VALQVIITDLIGSGSQVGLGATDDGFIAAGVTVGSTDNRAAVSGGRERKLDVQGRSSPPTPP
jgi:hypothetical protein